MALNKLPSSASLKEAVAQSENINTEISTLKGKLKTNLVNKGVTATDSDKMSNLISKVNTINNISIAIKNSIPSEVINGMLLIVTDTFATNIIFSHENISLNEGEILVKTHDSTGQEYNFGGSSINAKTFLVSVSQKINGKICFLNSYVGINNMWSQFCKDKIVIFNNGVTESSPTGWMCHTGNNASSPTVTVSDAILLSCTSNSSAGVGYAKAITSERLKTSIYNKLTVNFSYFAYPPNYTTSFGLCSSNTVFSSTVYASAVPTGVGTFTVDISNVTIDAYMYWTICVLGSKSSGSVNYIELS